MRAGLDLNPWNSDRAGAQLRAYKHRHVTSGGRYTPVFLRRLLALPHFTAAGHGSSSRSTDGCQHSLRQSIPALCWARCGEFRLPATGVRSMGAEHGSGNRDASAVGSPDRRDGCGCIHRMGLLQRSRAMYGRAPNGALGRDGMAVTNADPFLAIEGNFHPLRRHDSEVALCTALITAEGELRIEPTATSRNQATAWLGFAGSQLPSAKTASSCSLGSNLLGTCGTEAGRMQIC